LSPFWYDTLLWFMFVITMGSIAGIGWAVATQLNKWFDRKWPAAERACLRPDAALKMAEETKLLQLTDMHAPERGNVRASGA
jgi:hypothetical protein